MPYFVTYALIGFTILISFIGFRNPAFFARYKHSPYAERRAGEYDRLLTSGFLHGSIGHLAINMFVLYFFGRYAEAEICGYGPVGRFGFGPTLGPVVYLGLYLATIVVANLGTFFSEADNPNYGAIGASGAVSGATTLFAIFLPWESIYLYAILPIPAIIAAVAFVLYSQYASGQNRDNIDHSAHLFGALAMPILFAVLRPGVIGHFVGAFIRDAPWN